MLFLYENVIQISSSLPKRAVKRGEKMRGKILMVAIAILMLVLCFAPIPANMSRITVPSANLTVVLAPAEQFMGKKREESHGACYCLGSETGPPDTATITIVNSCMNNYDIESVRSESHLTDQNSSPVPCTAMGYDLSNSVGLMIPHIGAAPPSGRIREEA